MSADDKWSDDDTWDQVADGPLSPGQLAELLAACEQRPELWKRCAMALLEEQTLRHELQAMARDRSTYEPTRQPRSAANTPLPCSALADKPGHTNHVLTGSQNLRTLFWNNLALAASLLIVFGIGWQASRRFGTAFQSTIVQPSSEFSASGQVAQVDRTMVAPNAAPVENGDVDGLRKPPYEPQFGLAGNGYVADSGTIDQEMIDQANAEALATTMQSDWNDKLDPEYQQLRQAGYEVEAQKGLMPFWLHDGSSAVIPYQQIIVRPKSKSRNY